MASCDHPEDYVLFFVYVQRIPVAHIAQNLRSNENPLLWLKCTISTERLSMFEAGDGKSAKKGECFQRNFRQGLRYIMGAIELAAVCLIKRYVGYKQ